MATNQPLRRNRRTTEEPVYIEPAWPVFLLFLGYMMYMYLQGGVRWPVLGQIRFEFLMGIVLVPLAVVAVGRRSVSQEKPVVGWSFALLGTMLIMVALSHFPAFSWDVFWNRGVKFAAYGLCIAAFVSSPRALRWFLAAFLLAFFKMGLEGLLGTITGSLIWQNQEIPRLHGTTPSYEHPNSFSGTQLGVLPYLYFLYPLLPRFWKILAIVQLILCANVIMRTGSRTGYLGFVAAMLSFIWLAKKRARAAIVTVLIALMVVPMIPSDYVGRFSSIFEDKSEVGADTSIGKRKEILEDATEVFLSHPFGIGVGAFPLVRNELFGRKQDTHNLYLEVATNMGIQGIIVFIGFVSSIWAALSRVRRRLQRHLEVLSGLGLRGEAITAHTADIQMMLACAKATWAFLIIRLVLGAFGMDMYEIYWWFMAGLAVALLRLASAAERQTLALAKAEGRLEEPSIFNERRRALPRRLNPAAASRDAVRNP